MEIGYSSAVDPEAVRQDADARATLSRVYLVDCDYWDKKDENGNDVAEFDTAVGKNSKNTFSTAET